MGNSNRIFIQTRAQLEQCLDDIATSRDLLVVDVETDGLNPQTTQIVGVAVFAPSSETAYYLPVRHGLSHFSDEKYDDVKSLNKNTTRWRLFHMEQHYKISEYRRGVLAENRLEWLPELIEAVSRVNTLLGHNINFDLWFLYRDGLPVPNRIRDTMTMAHVVYPDWRASQFMMPDTGLMEYGSKKLKWLARLHGLVRLNDAGSAVGDEQVLIDEENYMIVTGALGGSYVNLQKQNALWAMRGSVVADYAMMDVEITYQLYNKLLQNINNWQLTDECGMLHAAQLHVAFRAFRTGLRLDVDSVNQMIEAANTHIIQLEESLKQLAPGLDNPNSSSQLLNCFKIRYGDDINSTDAKFEQKICRLRH